MSSSYDNLHVCQSPSIVTAGKFVKNQAATLTQSFSWWKLMIHIFSIVFTTVVLSFSLCKVYWVDDGFYTDLESRMDLLQFAAKIYEIVVVGSLSAMVLHFVRCRLLGNRGIPLGHLMSGYQASSVESLLSWSFWSPFKTGWLRNFAFGAFLLAVIIFSNLVGPSAAIALLPNIGWWPVKQNAFGILTPATVKLGPEEIYSMHLSAGDVGIPVYECLNSNLTFGCPAAGYNELNSWVAAHVVERVGANMTMTDFTSRAQRQLASELVSNGDVEQASVAIATTLNHWVLFVLGLLWQEIISEGPGLFGVAQSTLRPLVLSSDNANIKSPLVQVQCSWTDYNDALAGIKSALDGVRCPTSALNNFSGSPYNNPAGTLVPEDLYNFTRPEDALNFTWIDIAKGNTPPQDGSLGALVTLPYSNAFTTQLPNGSLVTDTSQGSLLISCTIDARWVGAGFSFDARANNVVATNVSDPSIFAASQFVSGAQNDVSNSGQQEAKLKWGVGDPIAIDPIWAATLDISGVRPGVGTTLTPAEQNSPNSSMIKSYFSNYITFPDSELASSPHPSFTISESALSNILPASSFANYSAKVANEVATVLSMALTDSISRSSMASMMPYFENNTISKVGPNDIKVSLELQRYGWGYGVAGSSTVIFGLVVLLLHMEFALAYVVYSIWFWRLGKYDKGGHGFMCDEWGESVKLITLALASKPPGEMRSAAGYNRAHSIIEVKAESDPCHKKNRVLAWFGKLRATKLYSSISCIRILKKSGKQRHDEWVQEVRVRATMANRLQLVLGEDSEQELQQLGLEKLRVGEKYE